MGGHGSGRRPDPIKVLQGNLQPAPTGGDTIFLPNYSGVKPEAVKQNPIDIQSNWTTSGANIFNANTGNVRVGLLNPSSKLLLPQNNLVGTPTLAFGDGDTGIYEPVDDTLQYVRDGVGVFQFDSQGWDGVEDNGPLMNSEGGTVNNPVFTNRSDKHTGMGWGAAKEISLIINNSSAMYIDANKNIGIGLTSPASTLHISGAAFDLSGGLTFGDGDTGFYESSDDEMRWVIGGSDSWRLRAEDFSTLTNFGARLSSAPAEGIAMFGFRSDEDTGMARGGTDILTFLTGTNEAMRILADSNVGIGTVSPINILEVSGAASQFVVTDAGNPVLQVSGARMGIGINTPSTKGILTINGNFGCGAGDTFQFGIDGGGIVEEYSLGVRDLDFRISGSEDPNTNRHIQFGHYSAGGATWNPKVDINSFTGDVGIGTLTPQFTLDVSGAIQGISLSGVNVTSGEDPGHTHTASSITEADPVFLALSGQLLTLHEADRTDPHTANIIQTGVTLSGTLSGGKLLTTTDHTASGAAVVVGIITHTSPTPPTASGYAQGTLYVQYTA